MHWFYTPDLKDGIGQLSKEESTHATRVLRLKVGDQIRLTNGQGGLFLGEISKLKASGCEVRVLEQEDSEIPPVQLHIGIAPTKNISRLEWFLEKATEIGIQGILPFLSEHSERKVIKPERLNKILLSAMKQSQRTWLPELGPLQSIKEVIQSEFEGEKFIAHCHENDLALLQHSYTPGKNALILIGPEGDFSKEEVDLAIENGFQPISLGTFRLRTETAALAACHTINLLNQPHAN